MTEASTDTIPTGIALALEAPVTAEIPVRGEHWRRAITMDLLPLSGRTGPAFHYPQPPIRLAPIVPTRRRRGFTIEPPVWNVSAVIEREHSLWARSRGHHTLTIPRASELGAGLALTAAAFYALGIVTALRAGLGQ